MMILNSQDGAADEYKSYKYMDKFMDNAWIKR